MQRYMGWAARHLLTSPFRYDAASRMPFSPTYLKRYLGYRAPTSHDQARMPQRLLSPSPAPSTLPVGSRRAELDTLRVQVRGETRGTLPELLAASGTTGFVVLHRGCVVWDAYPNGGGPARVHRCFSVTKSVASALVGIALGQGALASLDAPPGRGLPELAHAGVRDLTLAHLLEMRSGIRFVEGYWPWNDEPRTYYTDDLRTRLIELPLRDPVGRFFHYNDWHPQLIALILERITGTCVTDWLQKRLWNPLGAEHAGSMMVDRDDAAGVEHLESGLTASALDLAKFGQLYLQDGVWQGQRILPEGWVEATTSPQGARRDADWFGYYRERPWGRVFAHGQTYYKRMWWGELSRDGGYRFFAMGVLGQHVYVAPDCQVVVVRLSDRFPPGMWWSAIFDQVARAVAG
jgi:CubicO group peptidase (beta-lactamase class C family)